MADYLRTAKSGSDWGESELTAYNIRIEYQDAATFFGVDPLPRPAVANELLNNVAADDMANVGNYRLLRYMDLEMDPIFSAGVEGSSLDDFAVQLLTLLGYAPRTRLVRRQVEIPLSICGENCHGKSDVCIVDTNNNILLLVQEDKRHKEPKDAESHLIAQAVATFQINNYRRMRILNQGPLVHKVIPGITLVGISPIFYKIPVTSKLAECVSLGTFPAEPTIVHAHLPELASPTRGLSESMRPLDNRATILACYEAFKRFVN